MDKWVIDILVYLVIPGVLSTGAYFVKVILDRLARAEEKLSQAVTEPELRQILEDKIAPLRDDIQDIKFNFNKILDLLLKHD